MDEYHIFEKKYINQKHLKMTIDLDKDLQIDKQNIRLIKKVLCIFTDEKNEIVSLSNKTTVTFHTRVNINENENDYHHVCNLGKNKSFFTKIKQEEEGLKKSEYVWILDFGWMTHEEKRISNHMEFTFHMKDNKNKNMIMFVLYEDEDPSDYDFGWLLNKIKKIKITNNVFVNKYILQNNQ